MLRLTNPDDHFWFHLIAILLVFLAFVFAALFNPAFSAQTIQTSADRAVVRVCNTAHGSRSYGSGTYIEENGQPLILTCSHLFRDGVGQIDVGFPGGLRFKAQLLSANQQWDLAILSIPKPNITPVKIATDYPKPGDTVTSYGWGKDCRFTQSPGKVLGYVATFRTGLYETLYTTSRGGEGNSGGPILNDRNELVAVCWGGVNEAHGTFCDRVRRFLRGVLGLPPPTNCPPEGCKDPNAVDVLPGTNLLPDNLLPPIDQVTPPPPDNPLEELVDEFNQPNPPPLPVDDVLSPPSIDDVSTVIQDAVAGIATTNQVPTTLMDAAIPVALAALGWTGPPAIAAVFGLRILSGLVRRRRRKRSESVEKNDTNGKPFAVPLPPDGPLPQIVRRQREFVGYRVPSRALTALEWAHDEYVRRHPGARSAVETIESYATQYLSGHPDESTEKDT